jgi:protein-S-isoprenylcysteine O-methyltransferase Ste14
MTDKITEKAPLWVEWFNRLNTYLSEDLLGGPKRLKFAWSINLHKGSTAFFVILLMVIYGNYSTSAWVYLALHGSYGFIWLFKHFTFPDRKWEARVTYGAFVFIFLLLALYWIAPFLLISDVLPERPVAPGWLISLSIGLYALGVVLMMVSDCQKYFTLKYKRGLITDGVFMHMRHPNYLGEMMVYGSFALLSRHWIPWLVLAYYWIFIFYVNMRMAEVSLSRYPEWDAYKARAGFLLPWKILSKSPRK